MNVWERSSRRISNLVSRPQSGWYRVLRNEDAAVATRIDIYNEIGAGSWLSPGVSAVDFVAELASITGDVEVHINSPGGVVFDGLAIYNSLAQRPGGVVTVVDGLAASAASFIAQAGKTRIISPGAMMMIHDASGLCVGNSADMRELADLLDKVSDNLASIYADRTGRAAGWRDAMRVETWYTADEAVAAGLMHRVAERPEEQALAAAARFDLSVFTHAPAWLNADGAAGSTHGAYSGSHTHTHDANDAQGGDATHSHTHSHDGDGNHSHVHATNQAPAAGAVVDRSGHDLFNTDGAVDEGTWDGPAAMSAASKSDDPAAAFKAICAGRKAGDPDVQASWALPHHRHGGDPPNAAGVRNALSRLPQTDGLTNETAAKAHLDAHMAVISPDSGHDADDHTRVPAWLHAHLRDTHNHGELPVWLQPAKEATQ